KVLLERENSFQHKVWRASEGRFRTFLDSIPCLVGYVDELQCFRYCNTLFALFFDFLPQQVVGKRLWDVVQPRDYDAMRPHLVRAMHGEEETFEVSFHSKHRRFFHAKFVPERFGTQPEPALTGFFMLLLDVSDRKEYEEQQRANEQKFRLLAEER